MKEILLLFLFIFSGILYAQEEEELTIRDYYLNELINTSEEKSIVDFDTEQIAWRKITVEKITSSSYSDPSFLKIAMVLHMLQYKLGDEDYLKGINAYVLELNQQKESATVAGFKESLEYHLDIDLSDFFNDWFTNKGFPSYEISWHQNEKTHVITISVKQYQSDTSVSFFEMPVPVKVSDENGASQFIRLELSEDKQSFSGMIPFIIKNVEIDPEYQLISKNNIVKSGVDQETLSTTISLYPNPAKDFLNIQNSGNAIVEKVSIFNMLGKLVIEETNPVAAINLKPLSFGIHLVKIETSEGTLHKTILKKQ
ncbi:MAG TPA: T9SS type A sorting domain-containing protein [Flavobacteriia bacterium]|jgi:hypothetical protein|nr:T9SS type A sorting domain-containing protein [Flavobacteriia bacterium]